jgi:hypothetical protein
MTNTYVDGISDTVTHDITSRLTASQIEDASAALSIWVVSPDRWFPGDGAVIRSCDGCTFDGKVGEVCECTGQVVVSLA